MIRYAQTSDHPAIAEVLTQAFGAPAEADLTQKLRAGGDAMFELVAIEDGQIVGHIMFSRLWADREGLYAALAPLSVRPDRQRAGLGGDLVCAGLEIAREFGAHGVLVLGDPAYYPRFGFTAQAAAEVRAPWRGLPAYMALALEPGAFDAPLTVAYPEAFAADL